jgi:hypothetical protein
VGIGAAKVEATLLVVADFFPPFFCAILRVPGFFALGIFRFFPALRTYGQFAGIRRLKFCSPAFLLNLQSQGQYILKIVSGIEFILASLQKTCKIARQSRRCGEMADATDLKSVGL